jgi:hypothetical protein
LPSRLRRRGSKRKSEDSFIDNARWVELEHAFQKVYSRDTGKELAALLRAGEHDFPLFCEVFLGVEPLPWQVATQEQGLDLAPYVTAMLPNAGGKTVSFELFYCHAITYRSWAAPYWGTYWALHHGPKEAHALQVKQKIDAMLRGEAREQAFKDSTGWHQRPCLLKPFVQAAKHDKGLHEGFDFFGGAGMLTFRGTAQQAESTDGTDPMFIGMDEVRHEMYLTQIVESIFLPRALRAPGMRMYLPFTPLDASVEAVALHERGMRGHPDWRSLNMDLATANPTVAEEEKTRLMRNVNRRKVIQILGGKPIQPVGARFSREAVDAAFDGTETPEWLGFLGDGVCDCASCIAKMDEREPNRPLYVRVVARCETCWSGNLHISTGEKDHPMIAGIDLATSAASDSIVATVWDLWPPRRNAGVQAECVYLEEIEPGTRIQEVAKHAVALSQAIKGPVYFDAKGPLGKSIEDLSYAEDADLVAHRWNTADQKDRDLAYFRLMVDKGAWRCPFHLSTKSQMTHYVRDDKRIATDFLMAQVVAAHGARYYLPDMTELYERSKQPSAIQREMKAAAYEEPDQDGPITAREPFFGELLEVTDDGDPLVEYEDAVSL